MMFNITNQDTEWRQPNEDNSGLSGCYLDVITSECIPDSEVSKAQRVGH